MNLLERIATFENLDCSFRLCARGKRGSDGYRRLLLAWPDKIGTIKNGLATSSYKFSGYRKFVVHDPKARLISAPTFQDRVVHTAICQIIEPILDKHLSDSVYACRKGKGNRYAVIDLIKAMRTIGEKRFVIKLDVEKYFDSIDHEVLLNILQSSLPDNTIDPLLTNLLSSYSVAKGLPIGSLTSQLFSNLYLKGVDRIVLSGLGENEFYFRYMDDLVIGTYSPKAGWDLARQAIHYIRDELKLSLPFYKICPIGTDPLPFLGFIVSHDGYRILTRNKRRHSKQLKRIKNLRNSQKAEVIQSFEAWSDLEPHLSQRLKTV